MPDYPPYPESLKTADIVLRVAGLANFTVFYFWNYEYAYNLAKAVSEGQPCRDAAPRPTGFSREFYGVVFQTNPVCFIGLVCAKASVFEERMRCRVEEIEVKSAFGFNIDPRTTAYLKQYVTTGGRSFVSCGQQMSLRHKGRLLGDVPGWHGEPWRCERLSLVVNSLPGSSGLYIGEGELTPEELAQVAWHFEEIEFGLSARRIKAEVHWFLDSGEIGQWGAIGHEQRGTSWPLQKEAFMGPHTHPLVSHSHVASNDDWNLLRTLQAAQETGEHEMQESAQIVVADKGMVIELFDFDGEFRNRQRKITWQQEVTAR